MKNLNGFEKYYGSNVIITLDVQVSTCAKRKDLLTNVVTGKINYIPASFNYIELGMENGNTFITSAENIKAILVID